MCKVSRRERMPALTQFDKGKHRSRPLFGVTMERKQLWIWLLADNVDQLGSQIDWTDYNGEALDRNWEVLPLASIQFHRKPMEINGRTEWISLAWQADSSDYTPSPPTVWVPPNVHSHPVPACTWRYTFSWKWFLVWTKELLSLCGRFGCSVWRVVFQTEVGRPIILVALEACCCLITGCCKVGRTGVSNSLICICEASKLNFQKISDAVPQCNYAVKQYTAAWDTVGSFWATASEGTVYLRSVIDWRDRVVRRECFGKTCTVHISVRHVLCTSR